MRLIVSIIGLFTYGAVLAAPFIIIVDKLV
jgi:hypothetical protein